MSKDTLPRAVSRESDHEWHVALNAYNTFGKGEFRHWMYEAKSAASEVPRLTLLFQKERKGELRKTHQQCSHSEAVPVTDNKLTCCLGTICRTCPHLAAIEAAKMTDEEKDHAKAWTCVGHILSLQDADTSEGFILTEDDRMFWENVYSSLSQEVP